MEEHQIKARALAMSFLLIVKDFELAKQCAIVAVKEIISACEYNNVESHNTEWWNKVESELQKL